MADHQNEKILNNEKRFIYQGESLPEFEYNALKEIEEKIDREIPKEFAGRIAHGFTTKNGHVSELGITYIYFKSFTALPESIGDFNHLKSLILYHNPDLNSLPNSIGNLKNLQKLDINYIAVPALPETLGNLINIKDLYLRHCPLTSLPASFDNLSKIESLNLAGNQLTEIPDSIGNLSNLKKLSLEDNPLTSLPTSLTNLTNLQVLQLAGIKMKSLPEKLNQWILDLERKGCVISRLSDEVSAGWVFP